MKKTLASTGEIPAGYLPGIKFLEGLNPTQIRKWLRDELVEGVHMLSGRDEDFPVQAIINHYRHLSAKARRNLHGAIAGLADEWRQHPRKWRADCVRHLLSLTGELYVVEAKKALILIVEDSRAFSRLSSHIRPAVLRALASMGSVLSPKFWLAIAREYPIYGGMSFQALSHISTEKALLLLEQIHCNEAAIGGVARRLPDFVSEQPKRSQQRIILRIKKAMHRMPPDSAKMLKESLRDGGF